MLETSNVTVETLTDEIDLQMKVSRETLNQHAQPLADGLVGLCEQVRAQQILFCMRRRC